MVWAFEIQPGASRNIERDSISTYSYDEYGRPVEVDYNASKLDEMDARQMLHYDETTGAVTRLEDLGGEGTYGGQGAGTFSATYDVEGNILSETYPNQMIASYAYNSIGEAVSLQYIKSGGCTGPECEWFKDTLSPSIHGEALSQQSTLASDQYRYQQPGGLAEVQETPAPAANLQIRRSTRHGRRRRDTRRERAGTRRGRRQLWQQLLGPPRTA